MPQFDVSSFGLQIFWLVAVFSFLYFAVSKFIAPKAESILKERHRYFEENIENAEEYNAKAKSIQIICDEQSKEVHSRVEDMQKKAMALLSDNFKEKKEELALIINKKREHALEEIRDYISQFRSEGSDSVVSTAAVVIEKMTGKKVDVDLLSKLQRDSK